MRELWETRLRGVLPVPPSIATAGLTCEGVDPNSEIREFLSTRRARITPEQAGLPAYGTNRRVTGLRREEVAMLAGISAEYYIRIERGTVGGVSEDVLEGIVRALQLDEAERAHLFDLVRTSNRSQPSRRRSPQARVRPAIQRVLDVMTAPALVGNGRSDLLAANQLGTALYAPILEDVTGPPNVARFTFLNPHAKDFFDDWADVANASVANLRAETGRDPHDRNLIDLVGELSTRSDEFRTRWAAHNVNIHRTGTKKLHHPLVGALTLAYEVLELPGDPGQRISVYTAEPGSPSQQALDLLASWTSTPNLQQTSGPRNDS